MAEDEMVGWHHQFNGHEFEQALGVGEGQGRLVCYSAWGHKKSDMTERPSNSNTTVKTLMLAKNEGKRRQRIRWLDGITNSMDMNLGKLWEIVEDRRVWSAAVHGITKNPIRLSD